MKGSVVPRGRRGLVLMVAIGTLGVVLFLVVLMGRLGLREFWAERQSALEARIVQIAASAREWARVHAAELGVRQPVTLPVDALLPPGATGAARLERTLNDAGEPMVQCKISVTWAGQDVRRVLVAPVPGAGSPGG